MFCYINSFNDLDEVYTHQMIVDNNGKPICKALRKSNARLDNSNAVFSA